MNESTGKVARRLMLLLIVAVAVGCVASCAFVAGLLMGEGRAQRSRQEAMRRYMDLIIHSDPAFSNLKTEFGSGTQVYLVGAVEDEAVRQRLREALELRIGREWSEFIVQVQVQRSAIGPDQ